MSGRLRQSMWTVCGILLLVLVAGCGPRPKRDPRRTPRRPAKPLHIEPYAGVLSDEPALAAALDRLPAALEDAELQAGGALGIALDRRDRVRVTVEEGAGRPGAYSLSQVWRDRIRTWRVAIHSEPLVRGDGDLDRAVRAAQEAVSCPLLEDVSIQGAQGILVNITGGDEMTLKEVSDATSIIYEAAGDEANVIFGAVVDSSCGEEIRVTVIATGIGRELVARAQAEDRNVVGPRPVKPEDLVTPAYVRKARRVERNQFLDPRALVRHFAEDDLDAPTFLRRAVR